jgi:serine/threonine protein kinase/tetratricopeptide (TPR) repeat protein
MERKPTRPRRAVTRPFTISLEHGHLYNSRYEIIRTAAFGGMSRVYEAIDTETDETVALKVLSLTKIDDLLIRRFEREVQILQTLRHPNLVRAIDHGTTKNGDLFMALEWLNGLDLGDVMAERKLSPRESLEIVRGVLRGLEVVHKAGIVHRDLKPANIFVLENAEAPSGIKLLDFGVAKLVDEQMLSSINRPLTTAGMVVGTPYYMSPEQAQGSTQIDHRADLFAIGAALYEMVSGVRCFSASSALALLVKIATEEPAPISTVMPQVHNSVNTFLTKALKLNEADRFQSALEMETALAEVIDAIGEDLESTHLPGPGFEEGTERMDSVKLKRSLGAESESDDEEEDMEAITAEQPVGHSTRCNDVTLTEHIASDLEESHSTVVIAQLTGFTQTPDEVMAHFQSAVESLGGTFMLIRRSLALGQFSTGLGIVGRAMAASREAMQSIEGFRKQEKTKGSIRISVSTALKSNAGSEQLIDRACAQIEYAEPGEIIVDSLVRDACKSDLKTKTRRPGKHIALSYQDLPLGQNDDGSGAQPRHSPCSGRQEQLENIFQGISSVIQKNSPTAFVIKGGHGMGKSRFLWDLKEKLDRALSEATVFITQCQSESRALPVQAIADALRRSCLIRIGEDEETRFEKLLQLVPQKLERPKRVQTQETLSLLFEHAEPTTEGYPVTIPSPKVDFSPEKSFLEIQDELSTFLLACTKSSPLVFLIDDAHCCDRSSMRVLEKLLAEDELPFVLVLMVSANEEFKFRREDLTEKKRVEKHELLPLGGEATRKFAQSVLKTTLSDQFVSKLQERSGGHPYYLEELLHTFVDLSDKSDQALHERLNSVPSNLYALITSRIKELGESKSQFLSRAAIFGTHFWIQGLCALGVEHAQQSVEVLEKEDFIFSIETSRFSGSREYCFRNTMIRDVAYQMISGANYAQLHGQAARCLVEIGETDPVVLAGHYEKSGATNEAGEALCVAAKAALHSGDPESTLAFLEKIQTDPESQIHASTKIETLKLRQKAYTLKGHYEFAIKSIDELMAMNEKQSHRSRTRFDRIQLLLAHGNSAEALRHSREALDSKDARQDQGYGWLELAIGDALQARGDTITACTNYQESYARAKRNENRLLSTASVLRLGRIAYSTSDLNQAIKLYEKARRRYANELNHPPGEAAACIGLSAAYIMIGDTSSADGQLQSAFHIYSALGDLAQQQLIEVLQIQKENDALDNGVEIERAAKLSTKTQQNEYRRPALLCGIILLQRLVDEQRFEEAIIHGRKLSDNAIRTLPRFVITIESILGLALAYNGDIATGLKHTEAAVARLESQKAIEDDDPHRIYHHYAEALALAGQKDMAKRVRRQAIKTMTDVQSRLTTEQQVLFRNRKINLRIIAAD